MKRTILTAALAALIVTPLTVQSASARECVHNTIRVDTAYGISICVDPTYASKFQSFFSALKESGCAVKEIGCQAYGHVRGSNHIGGGACDVDQRRKNVTSACMRNAGSLIRAAGLYDGCSFGDCGHVEAMRGLGHYGDTRTYAARSHRHASRLARGPTPVTYARWNAL